MAKRKAAAARKSSAGKGARKSAARKGTARKRKGAAKKASARKASRKATGRKATARKASARKATAPKARKATKRKGRTVSAAPRRAAKKTARRATKAASPAPRKAPALNRERRTAPPDDLVPTPPSSLDLDRSASAVRSGRRGLRERYDEHTETSPALTAGDVDADWESAYSVGDEAPGGDNPTPDQDIVDDIGRAVGNEYQDTEELKGADKIAKRDKHRWELDPASAEDYDERD